MSCKYWVKENLPNNLKNKICCYTLFWPLSNEVKLQVLFAANEDWNDFYPKIEYYYQLWKVNIKIVLLPGHIISLNFSFTCCIHTPYFGGGIYLVDQCKVVSYREVEINWSIDFKIQNRVKCSIAFQSHWMQVS